MHNPAPYFAGLFALLCASCDYGPPRSLHLRVIDDRGIPVPTATLTFNYSTGGDFSGKKPGTYHRSTQATDVGGNAVYSTSVRRYVGVSADAAGFYRTFLYGDAFSQFSAGVGTSPTPVQIVLKRVLQPTPLLGKRAFIRVNMLEGRFSYDLVLGDLLPPFGNGTHSDFDFVWTRPTRNDITERRALFNVEAPGDGNGFVAFVRAGGDLASQSELISDFHAPTDGYASSTRVAHDRLLSSSSDSRAGNAVKGPFNDDLCYYIRIRSGERSLYGKIYGWDPLESTCRHASLSIL